LSSIASARRSAEDFKKRANAEGKSGGRLDIIIGNAAIAFPPLSTLSPDGYERTFAVNCLGHYVFITSLLGACFMPIYISIPYRFDVQFKIVIITRVRG
jgi:NAD(P)-dependent dehydrogenase (short-subunit alcohol dehydrogenase family)